jgi:hypothetical protein
MNEPEALTKQRRHTLHYLALIKSAAETCATMMALSDELREQSQKPMLAIAGRLNGMGQPDPNVAKAQQAKQCEADAIGQLNDMMMFVGKLQAVLKPPPEQKGDASANAN